MRGRMGAWERGGPSFVPPQNQQTGCRREDAIALLPGVVRTTVPLNDLVDCYR